MTLKGSSADLLVSDHLLSRGLSNSFKAFEEETQNERCGKLRSDNFVEETLHAIDKMDLNKLLSLWSCWVTKIFSNLTGEPQKIAKQYENDVYKLYLVRCYQTKDLSKFHEFFHRMAATVVNNPIWMEWFALPYNPNPQESPVFKKYFDRQWREILVISLNNFVSVAVHSCQPTKLSQMIQELENVQDGSMQTTVFEEELIDDFAVIAQCAGPIRQSQSKSSLKNLIKSFASSIRMSE